MVWLAECFECESVEYWKKKYEEEKEKNKRWQELKTVLEKLLEKFGEYKSVLIKDILGEMNSCPFWDIVKCSCKRGIKPHPSNILLVCKGNYKHCKGLEKEVS